MLVLCSSLIRSLLGCGLLKLNSVHLLRERECIRVEACRFFPVETLKRTWHTKSQGALQTHTQSSNPILAGFSSIRLGLVFAKKLQFIGLRHGEETMTGVYILGVVTGGSK